jgi:hypothetical protein
MVHPIQPRVGRPAVGWDTVARPYPLISYGEHQDLWGPAMGGLREAVITEFPVDCGSERYAP